MQPTVHQLLLDAVRVGIRLVDLVHRNDDRNTGRLCVVNRFNRLRHHPVVGGDNENDNVCYLRPARPHARKRFMARSVDKDDLFAIDFNLISTDVLRNAARFAFGDSRRTDRVEQRRLTVVYVTHDRNHRSTRNQISRVLGQLDFKALLFFVGNVARARPELAGHRLGQLKVQRLVDRRENLLLDELLDHQIRLDAKLICELLNSQTLGNSNVFVNRRQRDFRLPGVTSLE